MIRRSNTKACVKCGTALAAPQGGSTDDVALKSQADVATAPTAVVDEPSGDIRDAARAALAAYEPTEAIRLLTPWLEQHGEDSTAWEPLAAAHFSLGEGKCIT